MKPATRAPVFACMYHGLAEVARKHGYALAIHGTVTADLDLIAAPWTDEAVAPEVLKDALMESIAACGYAELLHRENDFLTPDMIQQIVDREGEATRCPSHKPHGRLAWNLYMYAGTKVDLSIMPRLEARK